MKMAIDGTNGRWTKKYFDWKFKVFERDNFHCTKCNTDKKLHAHHIIEWDQDVALRYDINNGLTLCSGCHLQVHRTGKDAWNKGKKFSDEYKEKLSIAHLGQKSWNKGKKMSPEYCKKASEIRMGVKRGPHSEEWKRKIGMANRETLRKNSESRIGKTWIKCPETGKRIWIDKIV